METLWPDQIGLVTRQHKLFYLMYQGTTVKQLLVTYLSQCNQSMSQSHSTCKIHIRFICNKGPVWQDMWSRFGVHRECWGVSFYLKTRTSYLRRFIIAYKLQTWCGPHGSWRWNSAKQGQSFSCWVAIRQLVYIQLPQIFIGDFAPVNLAKKLAKA
jgi:hypothetical protein